MNRAVDSGDKYEELSYANGQFIDNGHLDGCGGRGVSEINTAAKTGAI